MKKPKKDPDLPALSRAVKQIRTVYGDSQAEFGKRVNLAQMTVNRFERGKQIPTDFDVLTRLADAAHDIGLFPEAGLLYEARKEGRETTSYHRHLIEQLRNRPAPRLQVVRAVALPQWRLMSAARIAALYFPEIASAMEQVAGSALALVDEAIRHVTSENLSGTALYEELERNLNMIAEKHALDRFKEEGKK
jgi:transcriptional regulator with XRE-family HTH domain